MKWFDRWFYRQAKKAWEMRDHYEETQSKINLIERNIKMGTVSAGQLARGNAEGEDRISFELSSAIGGRILNVRRYDNRKDHHETQTYVIPTGEDLGQRVAKIINLEQYK